MPMEPSKRVETGSIKVEVNTSRSLYWREQDASSSSSSSTSNHVSLSSARRRIPQAQRHPESRERWGYDISTSTWLPSQTYIPEPKESVPLEMASGFHGSASPIAEAFERENSSSTEDYLIHPRKGKSISRDPRLVYQPSLENTSEYNSIQSGHRRSAPTVSTGHADFSLDSTLTTSSSTPATATSTSPATPLKWRSSKIPIPPTHSSSTHEAQSEFRYFCRNGRGKRPIMSSVSRHISTMSGMSAQLCHTGPNPLDSSQSPDSWENLHSKRSLQQQQQHREQNEKQLKQQKQQHREQNEKQLKQQKKHQQQQHIQNDQQQNDQQQNDQQQQTQQQNLKEDLRTVDSFAAHYSTSHDRIIRPSPISYHHFKPSPEVVHGPRHRRPKSPKIVNLNLPQSESQISQQDSSSSSLPLIDPPSNPSSSSTSCALSPSSSQYLPPETSNSLHSFITHPRGTVTQVDFPLHQASEIPEKSSQNTLGTSRPTSPLSTTCELLPQGSPYAAATSILNPTVGTKPSLASHQIDTIEILNEEESQDDAQSPSPAASYLISQPAPFLRSSIPTECQNRSHSQCASETIPEPATGPRHPATLPPVSPLGSSSILDAVLAAGDGNGNGASADATVANSGASMNTRTNMNTSSNITSVSNFSFTTISSYPVSLSLNTGMEWESETANAGPYATLSVETTATSNEDRQARSRSFGQRLRDTFWFKSKKRKQH